jgi:hypothetical protein
MATSYGLTSAGFVSKQQSDIVLEMQASLQAAFGQNINLAPTSVFGQLIGVQSEREALLWQLAEAVYNSQYPSGAEGASVDNILSLNGLKRLQPQPTVTNPSPLAQSNGVTLYGLALYGIPGTVVPADSIIQTSASPPVSFKLDSPVTIAAPANSLQTIFFGNAPTTGSFTLSLATPSGAAATTPAVAYNATAAQVQAAVAALQDTGTLLYPFTDVTVTGSTAAGSITFTFGGGTPTTGNPASGAKPQPLIAVGSNTMLAGTTATNTSVASLTAGSPAMGVGTATCVVNGPSYAPAGTITVIGTPVSGWTSVINQLDAIPGALLESDAAAMLRRSGLLSASANGPLSSIIAKVANVLGVTSTYGVQNTTNAALQILTFSPAPISGSFSLVVNGAVTTPIPYNATAGQVQSALAAASGYIYLVATGSIAAGITVDFNGSDGGQAQDAIGVTANTTGSSITTAWGRPPKSVEIIAAGGASAAIAQAIYNALPAGINSYGSPVLSTTGSATAGSTTLAVSSTTGIVPGLAVAATGVQVGAVVLSTSGSNVMISLPALSTVSNTPVSFFHGGIVADTYGNQFMISFSRPAQIPIYVSVTLITDLYLVPGVVSSGFNPKSVFKAPSILAVQSELVAIGGTVGIGGLVIGFGYNGLIGAFNNIPGIISYSLNFGTSQNPTSNANIQMLPEQVPYFATFNTSVTYV